MKGFVAGILLFAWIVVAVFAEDPVPAYKADGTKRSGKTARSMTPRMVIDTTRIVAGFGDVKLNDKSSYERARVKYSDDFSVFASITRILADSTKAVYSYGFVVTNDGIKIKSSGGVADTGLVSVVLWLQ